MLQNPGFLSARRGGGEGDEVNREWGRGRWDEEDRMRKEGGNEGEGNCDEDLVIDLNATYLYLAFDITMNITLS